MATVTANKTYRGNITENGTVTVTGRGECLIKVVGNTWDSGVLTVLDDLTGDFKAVDEEGTALSVSTGNRSWYVSYNPSDIVQVRLNMASVASASDVDVYVSFDGAPPG